MTTVHAIPTKVVQHPDWGAVCDALIAHDEPLCYAMTEYESRILYQFMYRRGYRISIRAVDGGFQVTKGAKVLPTKKEKR